jgi:DNA polymerase elongation subunit (family B)
VALRDRLSKAGVRVLTLDIESKPMRSYHWGLFKQFISINQIEDHGGLLCFAGKWYDEKETFFHSEWEDGYEAMVEAAHRVLSEADILISYNGIRYDVKRLNNEFLKLGMKPPKPFKHVDLFRVNKQQFDLPSGKLDYLAQQLGIGSKTAHSGFQLWLDVMAGDPVARAKMEEYNRQDVLLTEKNYDKLLPWIPNHPHLGMWIGDSFLCPNCGAPVDPEQPDGKAHTNVTAYNSWQCTDCGHWLRSTTKRLDTLRTRSAR